MSVTILRGDCAVVLRTLSNESVQCCVTSPPYWGLRDYGVDGQIGLEATPAEYVARLVRVFRAVRRTLTADGTLWLNLGDSYCQDGKWGGSGDGSQDRKVNIRARAAFPRGRRHAGLKAKDLVGIPWRVAFALQRDGWWLRSDIVWAKPNPMPESVRDRPTKSHEYVFLFAKSERYFYDSDAIREPHKPESLARYEYGLQVAKDERAIRGSLHDRVANGIGNSERMGDFMNPAGRNCRDVWTIPTKPHADAHFAVMPEKLAEPCILAGSRIGDTVLDPFGGSGTVGRVANDVGRHAILIELNADYVAMAERRTAQLGLLAVGGGGGS